MRVDVESAERQKIVEPVDRRLIKRAHLPGGDDATIGQSARRCASEKLIAKLQGPALRGPQVDPAPSRRSRADRLPRPNPKPLTIEPVLEPAKSIGPLALNAGAYGR